MLENSRDCHSECMLPDGQSLRVTKVEYVLLQITVAGTACIVYLTDVHLAPSVMRNIISYGKLENKGFKLMY